MQHSFFLGILILVHNIPLQSMNVKAVAHCPTKERKIRNAGWTLSPVFFLLSGDRYKL